MKIWMIILLMIFKKSLIHLYEILRKLCASAVTHTNFEIKGKAHTFKNCGYSLWDNVYLFFRYKKSFQHLDFVFEQFHLSVGNVTNILLFYFLLFSSFFFCVS